MKFTGIIAIILTITAMASLPSCSERTLRQKYECTQIESGHSFPAVWLAQENKWEIADHNNIKFVVDQANSSKFQCGKVKKKTVTATSKK